MRRLLCLLVALAALAGAGLAAGAQDGASLPALHRFVGSDGLGLSTVKRSDLDALWGRAEVEKQIKPSRPWSGRGSSLLLEYKSRGLIFTTTPGSYGESDPAIASATFSVPFDGCTPQGLCLGMPQEAAMPIIAAHYKITSDHASSVGTSGRISGSTYSARNKGWRRTHSMRFTFSDGALHSMSFELQPRPLVAQSTVRSVLATAILFMVVLGVSLLLRPFRKQLEPVRNLAKIGFVFYMLGCIVFGVIVLYALLGP